MLAFIRNFELQKYVYRYIPRSNTWQSIKLLQHALAFNLNSSTKCIMFHVLLLFSPVKCQPVHNTKNSKSKYSYHTVKEKTYEIKKDVVAQQASTTAKIIIMALYHVIRKKRIQDEHGSNRLVKPNSSLCYCYFISIGQMKYISQRCTTLIFSSS